MTTKDHDISSIRSDYTLGNLNENELVGDPIQQFQVWFDEALQQGVVEPNAMTLCTVSASGRPTGRIMLLKDIDESGFSFYTNYESRKGKELDGNPQATILFFWPALQRQVRIEGVVQKLPAEVADTYFQSRPKGSRLGAIASTQSREIAGRHVLEARINALEKEYEHEDFVPKPAYWGGYLLVPDRVEFWQGGGNRLHDRLCYIKSDNGWRIVRLAP